MHHISTVYGKKVGGDIRRSDRDTLEDDYEELVFQHTLIYDYFVLNLIKMNLLLPILHLLPPTTLAHKSSCSSGCGQNF